MKNKFFLYNLFFSKLLAFILYGRLSFFLKFNIKRWSGKDQRSCIILFVQHPPASCYIICSQSVNLCFHDLSAWNMALLPTWGNVSYLFYNVSDRNVLFPFHTCSFHPFSHQCCQCLHVRVKAMLFGACNTMVLAVSWSTVPFFIR